MAGDACLAALGVSVLVEKHESTQGSAAGNGRNFQLGVSLSGAENYLDAE